ncbi:MAG: OmpH family outer membrane protein [Flavobacteriales bacterium]|nr:OmpH family outer membrane protein [Flavobacteriales bacterium]
MKRILLIVLAMVAVNTAFSQKIGHIDSQALLEIMPEREGKMAEYEKFRKELDDYLATMQADYQKMIEEYQNEGATWPESYAQTKLEALANQERQIANFQDQATKDLIDKESTLFQPLIDDAKKAIEEVAAANGFTYILDAQALLFENGEDIMPLVKAKLGITE